MTYEELQAEAQKAIGKRGELIVNGVSYPVRITTARPRRDEFEVTSPLTGPTVLRGLVSCEFAISMSGQPKRALPPSTELEGMLQAVHALHAGAPREVDMMALADKLGECPPEERLAAVRRLCFADGLPDMTLTASQLMLDVDFDTAITTEAPQ